MSRLRGILISIALLAALPLAAPAKDEVIYPRNATPAGAPAGEPAGASRNWITGLLGLACAAGAGWFYWRNRAMGGTGPGRLPRKLTIAETRPLGNRQHLLVADYDGRKYLLGVCPGRIDLLTPLGDDPPDKS
jgi:flagellar protein FliO/FliZ